MFILLILGLVLLSFVPSHSTSNDTTNSNTNSSETVDIIVGVGGGEEVFMFDISEPEKPILLTLLIMKMYYESIRIRQLCIHSRWK